MSHFLGALLDENFDGKYHIAKLSKNLQKPVAFLSRSSVSTMITLNNGLLISFLQYGIVAGIQTFYSCIESLFM